MNEFQLLETWVKKLVPLAHQRVRNKKRKRKRWVILRSGSEKHPKTEKEGREEKKEVEEGVVEVEEEGVVEVEEGVVEDEKKKKWWRFKHLSR